MIFFTFTIIVVTLVLCSTFEIEDPIAETKNGLVKGKVEFSKYGRTFYSFKGIPYAKPPVGDRRFKPPENPDNWTSTLETQRNAPHCLQKNYLFSNPKVEGSEDCLYLNVYTPKLRTTRHIQSSHLLSVMVFIHWGGFFTGYSSSDYLGPEYFMDKNVILVTFNYRLGVLGFLSTNDDVAAGNYGLKDQLAVLKWVQNNIHYFGGNKRKVTIFGQSAGGASVHYHMLSPESKGLFHQGISESGSALALWAKPQTTNQLILARLQAKYVGCQKIDSSEDLIDCLRKVDGRILVDSGDKFKMFSVDPLNVYMPTVETKTENNPNPFMTKQPVDYIRNNEFNRVPWIIGVVNDEGLLRAEPIARQTKLRNELNKNFDDLMPHLIALPMSSPVQEIPNIWNKIKDFYFIGKSMISAKDLSTIRSLINLYTDRAFSYTIYQAALFHYYKGHRDIWFYNFNYTGQYSYGSIFASTTENIQNFNWGVSHCDDLLYLFQSSALFPPLKNQNDKIMIDNMINMWTNFAIYGNPSPYRNRSSSEEWLRLDGNSDKKIDKKIHYWNIVGNFQNALPPKMNMEFGFYKYRFKFWEDLPLLENIEELNQTHINF